MTEQPQQPGDDEASRRRHTRHALRSTITAHLRNIDGTPGESIGVVANLSQEGIMLVNNTALLPDHIYQICLQLPEDILENRCHIAMGIDCLWASPANGKSAMFWSGCQIIDICDNSLTALLKLIDELGE